MRILLSLTILLSLAACKKTEVRPNGPTPVAAENLSDVSYGTDVKQTLDVQLPAGRSADSTKIIVLIHGGSWTGGDKADVAAFIDPIRNRLPDHAIATINYRLATADKNHFPAQESDVHAAVNFIYSKRTEWKISGDIILCGVSAGGHLALLNSYKYTSPKVAAVVSFFGPADLKDMYLHQTTANQAGMRTLLDGDPYSNPSLYDQTSPVNFVSSNACPTLLLHGALDPIVPSSQAITLKSKLESFSVPVQYVQYDQEGHGWFGATLSDSFDKLAAFLRSQEK